MKTILKKGFTLIELLVVMTIISLLAGLLTPVVINAMDQAEIVDCTSNLKNLGIGIQQYKNMNSRRRMYPKSSGPVFRSQHASDTAGLRFIECLFMGRSPIFTEDSLLVCASNSVDLPNQYVVGTSVGNYNFDIGASGYLFRDVENYPIRGRGVSSTPLASDRAGNHNGLNILYPGGRVQFYLMGGSSFEYEDDEDPDSALLDGNGTPILVK